MAASPRDIGGAIRIPFFPPEVRNRIARIYHKPQNEPAVASQSLNDWLEWDAERVENTATLRLQSQVEVLKAAISDTLDALAHGCSPSTDLAFVQHYRLD